MTSRKRVLLADGSEEFRWLMWKNVANHDFFSLATVGSCSGARSLANRARSVSNITPA